MTNNTPSSDAAVTRRRYAVAYHVIVTCHKTLCEKKELTELDEAMAWRYLFCRCGRGDEALR